MIYKVDHILELCKNKNVLHIGCLNSPYHVESFKNGNTLHQKLRGVTSSLIGMDFDKKALDEIKVLGENDIYFGDIIEAQYEYKFKERKYDIIVFGDVIEHLVNPGLSLKNLIDLMDIDTTLILTTPNVWSLNNITNFINKKEKVHPDHTFWPSKFTLENIFKFYNLKIVDFNYCFYGSSDDKIAFYIRLFENLIIKRYPQLSYCLYYELKK